MIKVTCKICAVLLLRHPRLIEKQGYCLSRDGENLAFVYLVCSFSKDIRFMGFIKRNPHIVKAIYSRSPNATNKVHENENET